MQYKFKLSIITINLNNSNGIEKTINSVLSQTVPFETIEYIIIDGNSVDGSCDIIKKYEAEVSQILIEKDSGIYNAMNKGIRISNGEYLLFLNSGDILVDSNVISKVLPSLKNKDVYYGDISVGGIVYSYPDKLSLRQLFEYSLAHQSCFIKALCLKECLYDETKFNIISDCDWILNLLLSNGSFEYLPFCISKMEPQGASSNMKKVNKERSIMLKDRIADFLYDDYSISSEKGFSKLYTIRLHSKGLYRLISFIIRVLELLLRTYKLNCLKKYRY